MKRKIALLPRRLMSIAINCFGSTGLLPLHNGVTPSIKSHLNFNTLGSWLLSISMVCFSIMLSLQTVLKYLPNVDFMYQFLSS